MSYHASQGSSAFFCAEGLWLHFISPGGDRGGDLKRQGAVVSYWRVMPEAM